MRPLLNNRRRDVILAALRHHRRWALAAFLIVLAGTAIALAMIPRRFVARSDVWLDHGFERMNPGAVAASNSPRARNTEVRLLTSRELAGSVVDRLGLAGVRGLGQPASGPAIAPADARRAAIDAVVDNLRVETNGNSYSVILRYAAAEPTLAAGVLNHLADSYVADRRDSGPRGRQRSAMQAQVTGAREAAIRAEAAARGYGEAIGRVRGPAQLAEMRTELASLDKAIGVAATEQAAAEARLRNAQSGGSVRVTSPQIRDLRTRLAAPGALRSRELERDLAEEIGRVTAIADAADTARTRTTLLQSARTRLTADLRSARDAAALQTQLADRAAAARDRYASYAGRYRALVTSASRDPSTAYVIARANVVGMRRVPNPVLLALGGLLAACLAAAAVVFVREWLTKGFRTRQQMERRLGKPVIGMVPDLTHVSLADFPPDDTMGPADYLYNHRKSAFSAAFGAMHAGLRLGVSSASPRSVAICSALPEEGKTTVALCLARSAALAGLRVILVDCDSRRPAASRALSPYVKVGLAQVVEDRLSYRDAQQIDTPSGAWFLAQANDRPVSPNAVAGQQMKELIHQLERVYDLVLLDTAPVLALSEARELAAMADAVLLVARARVTPADATSMAADLLEQAGARVVATALTMVDP